MKEQLVKKNYSQPDLCMSCQIANAKLLMVVRIRKQCFTALKSIAIEIKCAQVRVGVCFTDGVEYVV